MGSDSGMENLLFGAGPGGAMLSYQAKREQAEAAEFAGEFNARERERYAAQVLEQAKEDEKRFRRSFARQEGSNIAAVGASGIGMSGSALDLLRENAILMEEDTQQIRNQARNEALTQTRQGSFERFAGRQQARGLRQAATAGAISDIQDMGQQAVSAGAAG